MPIHSLKKRQGSESVKSSTQESNDIQNVATLKPAPYQLTAETNNSLSITHPEDFEVESPINPVQAFGLNTQTKKDSRSELPPYRLPAHFTSQLSREPIEAPVNPVQAFGLNTETKEDSRSKLPPYRLPIQKKEGTNTPIQKKEGGSQTGMPSEVQSKMEGAFQSDFSDVSVHTDSQKASDIGALAYTQGKDIHFASGQFQPETPKGQELLGHELTHVVQQREGRVQPTKMIGKGMPVNDDPSLEQEADEMGKKAAKSEGSDVSQLKVSGSVSPPLTPNNSTNTAQFKLVAQLEEGEEEARSLNLETMMQVLRNSALVMAEMGLDSLVKSFAHFYEKDAIEAISSVVDLQRFVGPLSALSTGLNLAIKVWQGIPRVARTAILYLVGRIFQSIAPYIPYLGDLRGSYIESALVAVDATEQLSTLKWIVDLLGKTIYAINNPLAASWDTAKYIGKTALSYIWGSGEEERGEVGTGLTSTPLEPIKDPGTTINLKIVWLKINGFKLEKSVEVPKTPESGTGTPESSSEGSGTTDSTQEEGTVPQTTWEGGGLHADFAFGARAFNHEFSIGEQEKNEKLSLILPWSGGFELQYVGGIPLLPNINSSIFTLEKALLTKVKISNEGLKALGFSIQKLALGNETLGVIFTSIKTGGDETGLNFNGGLALNLFQWSGSANVALALENDGKFKQGSVSNFKESSGLLTLQNATVTKQGFEVTNAKAKLPESTGVDLTATLENLKVKKGGKPTGSGRIDVTELNLIKDTLSVSGLYGTAKVGEDEWSIGGGGTLKLDIDKVNAKGTFDIGYSSKTGFDANLKDGSVEANYDLFSLKSETISYIHKDRRLSLPSTTVKVPKLGIEVDAKGITLDKNGFNFEAITLARPGEFEVVSGVKLSDLAISLVKESESYGLKDGKGSLKTPFFSVGVEGLYLNKEGIGASEGTLTLGSGGNEAEKGENLQNSLTGFNAGILDFMKLDGIGIKVNGISITTGEGLKIESYELLFPEISFKAFGIDAGINVREQKAHLGAKYDLDLAKLIAPIPTGISVAYPIVPGLEVAGSLAAKANLGFGLDVNANGPGKTGEPWGVGGTASFNGAAGIRAELGLQLGSQAVIAIFGGGFAEAVAQLNANAGINGKTKYDKEAGKFKQVDPLLIDYSLKADAVARVGLVLKAKAFFIFEKTLYEYKAKEWNLGSYEVTGKIGDKDGEKTYTGKKMQLNEDNKAKSPEEQLTAIATGEAAKKKLLEISGEVTGGAEIKAAMILEVKQKYIESLNQAHEQIDVESRTINALENKQLEIIEQLSMALSPSIEMQKILITKNKKLQEYLRSHKESLEKLRTQMNEADLILVSVGKAITEVSKLESGETNIKEIIEKALENERSVREEGEKLKSLRTDESIEELVSRTKIETENQEKQAPIMSFESFKDLSTTKGFFGGEDDRVSIVPVDNALKKFHGTQNKENLQALLEHINTYLQKSQDRLFGPSRRDPAVKKLKIQVQNKLSQMD